MGCCSLKVTVEYVCLGDLPAPTNAYESLGGGAELASLPEPANTCEHESSGTAPGSPAELPAPATPFGIPSLGEAGPPTCGAIATEHQRLVPEIKRLLSEIEKASVAEKVGFAMELYELQLTPCGLALNGAHPLYRKAVVLKAAETRQILRHRGYCWPRDLELDAVLVRALEKIKI